MTMSKRRRFVLAAFFVCLAPLCAQDIRLIMSDPDYYSAEGIGITVDEADRNALEQISRQISVSISSATEVGVQTSSSGSSVASVNRTQTDKGASVSFVSLQNVNRLVLATEPDARVFRWVAKSEVEKMFEARKQKIIDFVETGQAAERRLQIDDAIRNYYWALMLAKVNADAVYAGFDGKQENCLSFLPLKIKSVIANIKADIKSCVFDNNRYKVEMDFTYSGYPVSSVRLSYYDGQSFVGPVTVKDGFCELELLSLPANETVRIQYEYRFSKEAESLDADLKAAFSAVKPVTIDNALVNVPVKIDVRKNTLDIAQEYEAGYYAPATDDFAEIKPESIKQKQRMELDTVDNSVELALILQKVEEAIDKGEPESVYEYFTTDAYRMFDTLLKKTGKVSLAGRGNQYEFIHANGQILGRFCKISIKFKDGTSFNENLAFRFNPYDNKIQSLAFALSQKAEDDIFNAAAKWTDASRFTLLQFMEDYQTAYALKRLDYIEQIFSDDAIIITGTVLKPAGRQYVEGSPIDFNRTDVQFTTKNKQQFIETLRRHFNDREYVHLTFQDNQVKMINAPRIPQGSALAIQINQLYNSPVYSDQGYLTLVLDTSDELPLIHVRLWQPDKTELVGLDEFMSKWTW